MSATWKFEGAGGPDDDVATETVACVERTAARVTVEWRREMKDGRKEVVTARYRPDGTLVGAWRGPPGGTGAPLRIVRSEFDEDETRRRMERQAAPFGGARPKVETEEIREVVETPAGRFPCIVRRVEGSFLFVKTRMTCAWPVEPVPMVRIVRLEWRGNGMDCVEELVALRRTGAAPSLAIPE